MLYYVSLTLEVIIVILGLRMVFLRKRLIGAGLALSFTLYVVYNLIKQFHWSVSEQMQDNIFFIATLTIFLTVLVLERQRV